MPKNCTRGTVLEVNLDPSVGREYMKSRPCLVVQSDLINRHSQLTIVAPITGAENNRTGPTIVPIPQGEGGLTKDSVVICHQIRVVDESRLGRFYGHVRAETMRRVQDALKIVFDIQC
jgi:mRNA interferase MazF